MVPFRGYGRLTRSTTLALLTTGVRLGSSNLTTGGTPREGTFNVNGLRSTFNNFLIDGVDNNAYGTSNQGFSNQVMQPPPDAIGEFKVVTNNLSAEYGRSGGATSSTSSSDAGTAGAGGAADAGCPPPDAAAPMLCTWTVSSTLAQRSRCR